MAKRSVSPQRLLNAPPKNRGNFRGHAKRGEEENNMSEDEILDIWHPFAGEIRCRDCSLNVTEILQDVSILDTYRCPAGHRTWKIGV